VFQSGFAESSNFYDDFIPSNQSNDSLSNDGQSLSQRNLESPNCLGNFEDSDEEDEGFLTDSDAGDEPDVEVDSAGDQMALVENQDPEVAGSVAVQESPTVNPIMLNETSDINLRPKVFSNSILLSDEGTMEGERSLASSSVESTAIGLKPKMRESKLLAMGPRKARVDINDAAYTTYRAVLFYVRLIPSFLKTCNSMFNPFYTTAVHELHTFCPTCFYIWKRWLKYCDKHHTNKFSVEEPTRGSECGNWWSSFACGH